MRVSIIVAVANNAVIGRGGALPWHLPEDLRRFKRLTMGHSIVMGRRTWESIARRLPGRRMVVVSRQAGYQTGLEGVFAAASLDEALQFAESAGEDETFVIGGAKLYSEALPRADRLYVTRVEADVTGDVWFPAVDWRSWQLVSDESYPADASHEYSMRFEVYERR